MSGPGDRFGADTAKLEEVQQLRSTAHLAEYTGVLTETGDSVHLLTLAPELADTDAAVDAFSRVSDQWYNASANANIRPVRARGTTPRPWIAVPDTTEATLATTQPSLSPAASKTVIAETADALRTLGLYNTVHGQLTPDDIYLPDGIDESAGITVEVGGFGLEAAIGAASGTYEPTAYTPPELVDGLSQLGEQADVYGLGAVTYFALTGQPPITGSDLPAAIRDGPTAPPSAYADDVSQAVDDVVMKALAASPADRYDSPYAFHRAFASAFDPADVTSDTTDESPTASGGATADSEERADDTASSESQTEDGGSSVTRRAALGLLGLGAIGAAGAALFGNRLVESVADGLGSQPGSSLDGDDDGQTPDSDDAGGSDATSAGVYADWLPAPERIGGQDHYPFSYFDMEAFESNEDELSEASFDPEGVERLWSPLEFGWRAVSNLTLFAEVGFPYVVIEASFDREGAITTLANEGFEEDSAYNGYTVMRDTAQDRAYGVGDGTVAIVSGQNSVGSVETILDTDSGDTERYDEASDDMATLIGELGGGSFVRGETMAPPDRFDAEQGEFPGMVARGSRARINGATTAQEWVIVYESSDDVDTDDLETWVDANRASGDQFESAENISYSSEGRVGIVTATGDTSDI